MANNTTNKVKEQDESEKKEVTKPVAKEVDLNQLITVRNGFQGRLIYKSSRTNEKFVWDAFGDEQELELRELRSAKSSAKKFFINNWFAFDDEFNWVIDYLGVRNYYKNSLSIDDFDTLFTKSPAEIEKTVSKLSEGQKKSVAYKARLMIANGEIDSNKAIAALEKALSVELIER